MEGKLWKLAVLGLCVLLCAASAHSAVIHVKTTGNNANDGLTWDTAKQTVQAGLDAAVRQVVPLLGI